MLRLSHKLSQVVEHFDWMIEQLYHSHFLKPKSNYKLSVPWRYYLVMRGPSSKICRKSMHFCARILIYLMLLLYNINIQKSTNSPKHSKSSKSTVQNVWVLRWSRKKGSGIHISKSGAIYCQRRHRHIVYRVSQNQMCKRSKVIQTKNETIPLSRAVPGCPELSRAVPGCPPVPSVFTVLIEEWILMLRAAVVKGSVPCLMAMSTSLFFTVIVFGLLNLISILFGIP